MVASMPRTVPVKCPMSHSLSSKTVMSGSGVCTKCAHNLQVVSQSNSVALYYTCNTHNNCIHQLCMACAEVVEYCGTLPLPAPPPNSKPPTVTNPFFEPRKNKAAKGGGISKPQGGKKKKTDNRRSSEQPKA